jgi:hypothetical protein
MCPSSGCVRSLIPLDASRQGVSYVSHPVRPSRHQQGVCTVRTRAFPSRHQVCDYPKEALSTTSRESTLRTRFRIHEPSVPPAPCPSPVYSCDRHLAKKMSQADYLLHTRSYSFTQCSGYTRLSQPVRFSPSAAASFGQSPFLV